MIIVKGSGSDSSSLMILIFLAVPLTIILVEESLNSTA